MSRHRSKPDAPGSITSSSTQSGAVRERHGRLLGIGSEQDAEAVRLQEVPHQRGDLGLVLHDEHKRPGWVRDGAHQHSLAHRRRRNADFRRFFAACSHEVELPAQP